MYFRTTLACCACCAALGLAACGGGTGGVPTAEHERVQAALAGAEAERDGARTALQEAQAALAAANALLADADNPEQREKLGATLTETRVEIVEAAARVAALPPPPAAAEPEARQAIIATREATVRALNATGTALDAMAEAVRRADAAAAAPVAADAHTALDRAQTAMTTALGAVADARALLAETPDPDASDALLQAQNALLTAQLSLTPVIRAELDESQTGLAAARAALADERAALAAARAEAARLAGVVTARTGERDTARRDLAAARAEVTRLEGVVAARQRELDARTGDLKDRTAERDKARRDLAAARADVTRLEGEVARLEGVVTARTTERDEARRRLDALTLVFGEDVEMPEGNPLGSGVERTRRMTGVEIVFHDGGSGDPPNPPAFNAGAGSSWGQQTKYTATGGTYTPREAPGPVGYAGDTPMLFGTETPPQTTLPGRGTVFRGMVRAPRARANATTAGNTPGVSTGDYILASDQGGYELKDRLVIQGRRVDTGPSHDSGGAEAGLVRAELDKGRVYKNWDAIPQTSFRYDPEGGFTMFFGGTDDGGALIFGDLEPFAAKGGNPDPDEGGLDRDDRITDNIEISFGEPKPDPYGDRGYWWLMETPNPKRDLKRDNDGNPVLVGIAAGETVPEGHYKWMNADGDTHLTEPVSGNPAYVTLEDDPPAGVVAGTYEAFLSNHAGPSAGADGTLGTADDEQRYLRYAAYGLLNYVDYNTHSVRPGRFQTFHYGFDAFDEDADTPTPAVPPVTDNSIAATFAGKTSGWVLLPVARTGTWDTTRGVERLDNCGSAGTTKCHANFIDQLIRLRGDVSLTACIGGGGCSGIAAADANEIEGSISNFEYAPQVGYWSDRNTSVIHEAWRTLHGKIDLAGTIAADGSYKGDVTPNTAYEPTTQNMDRDPYMSDGGARMSDAWGEGEFEGAFYGPQDALETAGTWWVPAREDVPQYAGMAGSFGAACTDCGDE